MTSSLGSASFLVKPCPIEPSPRHDGLQGVVFTVKPFSSESVWRARRSHCVLSQGLGNEPAITIALYAYRIPGLIKLRSPVT